MKFKEGQPVKFKNKEELIPEFGVIWAESFANQIGFYSIGANISGWHRIKIFDIPGWASNLVVCSENCFTKVKMKKKKLPKVSFLAGEKVND